MGSRQITERDKSSKIVHRIAELTCNPEITKIFRNTWVNSQTPVGWLYTPNFLG